MNIEFDLLSICRGRRVVVSRREPMTFLTLRWILVETLKFCDNVNSIGSTNSRSFKRETTEFHGGLFM